MDDPLENALDIMPAREVTGEAVIEISDELATDFAYARENIYQTIEVARNALLDLADLAKSAQSARVYEVVATLTKTIIDAQHQLLELQKKKKDVETTQDGPTTINNNLIMTTAEIGRMIADLTSKP